MFYVPGRQGQINLLLYKAEMTSVCLSVCLSAVMLIAQWFMHGWTWDLVCVQLWPLTRECTFK